MFGFSLRERAAEALRRGARAAMTGGFFHHSEVDGFGLNKEASSFLYTEALSHQIYALGLIFGETLVGKEKWATPEFFFESVGKGIAEHEKEQSLMPGSVSSFVFKRFMEIENLTPQERNNGEHFNQSTCLIKGKDISANSDDIVKALMTATEQYYSKAKKMF